MLLMPFLPLITWIQDMQVIACQGAGSESLSATRGSLSEDFH